MIPNALPSSIAIACVDVGSVTGGNLGWAIQGQDGLVHGCDLVQFTRTPVAVLANQPLALGFECPLYVPRKDHPALLASQRLGETGLNWCGGPGAAVLATGLVQVNWVLTELTHRLPTLRATLRWPEFVAGSAPLFIWEAFITSQQGENAGIPTDLAVCSSHERDAIAGVTIFQPRVIRTRNVASDLGEEHVISLIGMQLLMTGLSIDRHVLEQPCLAIKARKPQ